MFDHVSIRVSDRPASEAFYDTVLAVLDVSKSVSDEHYASWGAFDIMAVSAEHPLTRRLHISWFADTRELVHEFYEAGIRHGYRGDGEPGPRPQYGPDYYGGFLLDPDGNSVEAVNTDNAHARGEIDHLWLRAADVRAARDFYRAIAPFGGFRAGDDEPDRAQFLFDDGSFSFVAGDAPTENVHLAFTATENATVDAFHAAVLAAGHRDNGAPGERPYYHPGYYGAFVLDPDGNNIEVVNHNRS
jgi:catechol 2,3-dioxygenase-like lactoylglutathione lyase family enzyme